MGLGGATVTVTDTGRELYCPVVSVMVRITLYVPEAAYV